MLDDALGTVVQAFYKFVRHSFYEQPLPIAIALEVRGIREEKAVVSPCFKKEAATALAELKFDRFVQFTNSIFSTKRRVRFTMGDIPVDWKQ